MHDSFSFSPKTFLEDELLWRVQWFEVPCVFYMVWWVAHQQTCCATEKKKEKRDVASHKHLVLFKDNLRL